MALKPEAAVLTGLAVGATVFAVSQVALPNVASVRASQSGNGHLNSARRSFTLVTSGIVAGISLITRDPTVFVIGGAAVVAVDFLHRHANAVDHKAGIVLGGAAQAAGGYDATAAPTGDTTGGS